MKQHKENLESPLKELWENAEKIDQIKAGYDLKLSEYLEMVRVFREKPSVIAWLTYAAGFSNGMAYANSKHRKRNRKNTKGRKQQHETTEI